MPTPVPVHHRYFAVLKEQHAMTQTAEPGIKSEHSENQRIRENGAQTNNTAMRSATIARMVKEKI
jgi:hypothetical protein